MFIFYLLVFILIILLLGSIVPILQFLVSKRRRQKSKKNYKYVFSDELINYDFDFPSLKTEQVPRTLLATRGWVRGPQGNVMSENLFDKKKSEEYSIKLP